VDNTPDWDSLSDTPPAVAPVVQDRSTPVDAQVADFADEANRRVAAGEDPATVEADLQSQVQSAQPKIPKGKTAKASEWDSLLDAPPELPGPPEEVGPPAALAGSPAPDTTATGDVPPDFGTGGGPLDTSGFAPAMAAQGRAIAIGIPRALAGGEASLVKFAANIAPAVVAGTGNIAGGQALEQTLSPYAEEAGQVEQQVAQERADDRASGASTPISRAIESGVGAAYALPQYAVVPEFEGADLAVAAVKALPASYSAAKTTFADLLPKVGVAKALEASGLTGIVNLVGASLPLGAAGTAAERVAAGAGVGVASEEAGRAGQNVILSDHPELQQPLDPEAIVQAGLTGGALGGFAGHPRLSDADIAAARVQQLTRGLTNAREIPQDQGGVPSQGTVEEGGREGGGENLQRPAQAGPEAGNAEGLTDVDQNVQPVGTERAAEEAQAGEEGKVQAAPEVLADQGTADATASVAPDAQVPGDADTARAADAVAAGEEGLPAESPPESLITDHPDDDWLRANPRKNPELFGINRPKYPSLLEWVARGGGLNREAFRAEYGVDPAYWNTRKAQRANQKIVGKPLFRKDGGMTPEDLREAMQQDGWLPPDSPDAPSQHSINDAFELFDKALSGKDIVHPGDDNFEAMARHVEDAQRSELEDRAVAKRLGYDSADEMRAAHEADNRVAETMYARQQDLFGAPKEMFEKAKAKRAENLDLFGGATSKDAVDAAQRAKDLALRGGDRSVPMRAGDGELFAGDRPEQAKLAQREGAPQTDNLTHAQAREALTREFGTTAMRKLEANGLTLTPRADLAQHTPELTPQQRAGVKGFTPPDKSSANVIHDNVTRAELPETVIHEVVHANLDRILPESTRNALASAIQARASKSPEVKASLEAIPKTTPKANYREEVLAQTMGDLYTQPIGRKVLDAFKLGLNRMGVPLDWINAHEAAIRQIGIENLRHYAEAPRRNPVTTVQMAPRAAPAGAGQAPAEKPRIRVPVDQVPVQRVAGRAESAIENPESAIVESKPGSVVGAPPVSKPETPTASPDAIGTKNAAKAAERGVRGLEPVVSELRPAEKDVWDAALKRLEADPTVGYRLSAELAKNPRAVSSEDEALLMQHGAELHNRYDDVLQRIETAQKAGNTADAVNAQMERMAIEQDLATNEKATKEIGTEWSATGRMRQKLAERDFSMARQVLRFKAITGVDDLPQALRDQIAQHVKTIQAREAELSAALAENAKLREQQTAPVARRRIAPAERRTLDDEFSALAQRAAQLRKTAAGGTRYARVEDPELASVIRRMARNRSDAGETDPQKVLAAIHEAIGGGVPKQDIADTITSNAPYRKQTQNELQQRYNDLKRALRDPAVQRDATRAKQLQSQLSDIKSRIQRKDFSPPDKREKPVYGEAVQHLQLQIAKAKNELNALATRQERLNDTPLGKTLRTIVDAKIFNILASVSVYKKLAGAVVTRNASQIGEEALGTVLAKLPGLRKYAAYSPRYGGRGFWAGMGEFGKGLKDAFARAKEDLQQNQNKWDILYGHKRVSQEFTDFSGRMGDAIRTPGGLNKAMETAHAGARFIGGTHAAMKEFVSEPEMRVAQMQIGRYTREQLLKKGMTPEAIEEYMGRESTMASVQAQAYEHALESKFQGKNTLTQAINSTLARWEKTGGIPGKIAAFLAKEEYPVRGIPVNIAKELLTSYPFGAFKAMAKAMRFDTLKEEGKPAAADYIMKNLRKQGVGIATLALGGYLQSQLGGVPHAEKKDKSAPVKPGEAMVAGQNVGTQIMHGPVPELMEMGASLARVYRREYGSRGFTAFLESLAQVYPTLALQSITYTDQPMRQARTVENAQKYDHRAGYDKLLGEMIRSNVVPAAVQQAARAYDPYQGFRNARNIPEDVKLGVPGLREQVPHSR